MPTGCRYTLSSGTHGKGMFRMNRIPLKGAPSIAGSGMSRSDACWMNDIPLKGAPSIAGPGVSRSDVCKKSISRTENRNTPLGVQ